MEKELQNTYPTDYNLITVQDLWQAHHQILLITLLKGFIKLNVNTDTMVKNVKRGKFCDCFLDDAIFKDDLTGYKYLCCNKNYENKGLMKT